MPLKKTQKPLIYAGACIPMVFWVTLAFCGKRLENYNPFSNLVSELGAVGTPTQHLFTAGLLICSALSLVFVGGLYRECRQARISVAPALFLLTYSFSIAGAAIYPMPHRLHGILGSPSLLLVLSPVLAAFLWKKADFLAGLRLFSLLTLFVMSLGFLVFFPDVLEGNFGLKQRFFHLGWSIWFIYLSVGFSGLRKQG